MPELRERLTLHRRPEPYLVIYLLLVGLLVADTFQAPGYQVTGRAYVQAATLYQQHGHLALRGRVRCRYVPSCSHYSIEAVQRYGIRRGLVLSYHRIVSCRPEVPMGTFDPVPGFE